jgi:hypothetical protein
MAAATEAKEAASSVSAKQPIAQTSLAARGNPPGQVTVQFRKWHAHGQTAYQKGQFAGFPVAVAEGMERSGVVVVDPGARRGGASDRMVRK